MTERRQVVQSVGSQKYKCVLECVVFGVIAFLFAVAPMYNDSAEMQFTLGFVARFVLSFVLLAAFYALLCFLCNRRSGRDGDTAFSSSRRFDIGKGPKSIVLIAVFMLLLWAPYGICLYPGVVFFDTSFQLGQFFGNPNPGIFPMYETASYTDHHPLLDTLLFGVFVKAGAVFTSANVGMFAYLIVQAILTALSLSWAVVYMRTVMKVPRNACLVFIVFLAICPIFPVFVFSMTKDSLFSWLYVIFFIQVIDIVRTRGKMLARPRNFIAVVLVAVALGLVKKTGVYVVLLTFIVLCFFVKRYWKKLACAALLPMLATAVILPMLVFPLLNVSPGSKVEVLGFFYQQTARYVVDYPDDVTPDERAAIAGVLDYDHLAERYAPGITNTIKNVGTGANLWPSFSQIADYVGCYLSQGLRHPDVYFAAVASLEAGWFDWSDTMALPTVSGLSLATINGEPNIHRPGAIQVLSDKLAEVLALLEGFLPTGIFLKMPLYAAVIPVFTTLCLLRKNTQLLPAMIPVWVSFLLLMMSPVSGAANAEAQRYLLPFVYSAPSLLMLCMARLDDKRTSTQRQADTRRQST